ncbi:MAG: hypothetical protein U7126_32310 [Microcoleus sp.]
MPVPQKVNFLVGRASCPPVKALLTMVQDLSWIGLPNCRWQDLLQEYSFLGNALANHLRSPGTAFMSGSASGVRCSVN